MPPQPATLAPGAQIVCTGSYTLTQADVNTGQVTNTATADSDQTPPTETTVPVPVPQAPALTLAKDGTLDTTVVAPADRADVGDKVNYTLTATNAGNVTLTGVTIERSEAGGARVRAAAAGDAGAGRADGLHGQLHADAGRPRTPARSPTRRRRDSDQTAPTRDHGDGAAAAGAGADAGQAGHGRHVRGLRRAPAPTPATRSTTR